MNRRELNECVQLGTIIFNRLLDVKEKLNANLNAIFHACGVEQIEDIKDIELYKIASELEYNAQELRRKAEDLETIIEGIAEIDLTKC